MDPGTATMLAGLGGSGIDYFSTQSANKARAQEAQKARDWSEHMSNTTYQRKVADLLAAGLNPMLALGSPNPPVPAGIQAAGIEPVTSNTSVKLQSALQNRLLVKEDRVKDQQIQDIKESAALKKSNITVNSATAEKIKAETAFINSQNKTEKFRRSLTEQKIKVEEQLLKVNKQRAKSSVEVENKRRLKSSLESKLRYFDLILERLPSWMSKKSYNPN